MEQILASAQARVAQFHAMGGYLAPGSDAGAYAVFHGAGGLDEFRLLSEALGPAAEAALDRGISAIRQRFSRLPVSQKQTNQRPSGDLQDTLNAPCKSGAL